MGANMKRIFKAAVAGFIAGVMLISGSACVSADTTTKDVSEMTPQEIVNDMKIGWNLGNSLDCYGSGYSSPTSAETYWGNPATTKAMIDKVKSAGFNTLRIPVTWYDKCDSNGTIDSAWLARVKEVVDYGRANDMYVIINLHHEDGGNGRSGWLIPDYSNQAACEAKIADLWTQIATYFKDYDRHLIFESMNEPRMVGSSEEWTGGTYETRIVINALNAKAVEAIRATGDNNATRLIMCPPCAAKIDALNDYSLPDDSNLAISIHNYSPYQFAMNQYGTAEWGSDADKAALKSEIERLYNNYVSKGIPVIIGEMGATYKYNDESDDRPLLAQYYTSTARSYGITCVVWDNNSTDGESENFGLLNRSTLSWYFPSLVEAYIKGVDETAVIEPDPDTGSTVSDPYGKIVFEGNAGAEAWAQPFKAEISSLPAITEGCTISVAYSGTNAPYLVFQIYTEGSEEWNQMLPDYTSNGVAYYSYDTITANCKSGLDAQQQMLIMSNADYTTVTNVTINYPRTVGDINNDGQINNLDTTRILKYIAGLLDFAESQKECADVNSDNTIDLRDAIYLLNN